MDELLTCRKCGCQTWTIFADRIGCCRCGCSWYLSPLHLMDRDADKEPDGIIQEGQPRHEGQPQAANNVKKDSPQAKKSLSSPQYFSEHVLPKLRPTDDKFQALAYANWKPEGVQFWDEETQRLYTLWITALGLVIGATLSTMSDQKEHI